jgi:hypothetical protein
MWRLRGTAATLINTPDISYTGTNSTMNGFVSAVVKEEQCTTSL